jgi:hypothetical protein
MNKRLTLYIIVLIYSLLTFSFLPFSNAAIISPCFEREYSSVDINVLDINGRRFYQNPTCDSIDSDGDGIPDIYDDCPFTFPARIGFVDYSSLQDAYNAAFIGATIKAQFVTFAATLNINRPISVTVKGGYDCLYTANTGMTIIEGNMTVTDGVILNIENFIIENTGGAAPLLPPGGEGVLLMPIYVSPAHATSTPAYIGN